MTTFLSAIYQSTARIRSGRGIFILCLPVGRSARHTAAPALVGEGGLLILFMVCDFEYILPAWPEEEGKQQKQMHFNFKVDDLLSAVEEAIKLGTTKAAVFNKIGISAGFSTDKRACCRIFILQHALPDLLIIKRIFAQV